MNNIKVVRIYNPEKYKPFAKEYGILVDSLQETAVINWNGNRGGICTNVEHKDYYLVSPCSWDICDGEIMINGYVPTGLEVWDF